jgi:hypothetical protein
MTKQKNPAKAVDAGSLKVSVHEVRKGGMLVGATVALYEQAALEDEEPFDARNWRPRHGHHKPLHETTGRHGYALFHGLKVGTTYVARYENYPETDMRTVTIFAGESQLTLLPDIDPGIEIQIETPDGRISDSTTPRVNDRVAAKVTWNDTDYQQGPPAVEVNATPPLVAQPNTSNVFAYTVHRPGLQRLEVHLMLARLAPLEPAGAREHELRLQNPAAAPLTPLLAGPRASLRHGAEVDAEERPPQPISGNIGVSLSRTETEPTEDLSLWTLIRNSTDAMSFTNYLDFIDGLFCGEMGGIRGVEKERFNKVAAEFDKLKHRRALPFTDSEAYRVLKAATEAFVMVNCGVRLGRHAFNRVEDNAYLDRRDLPDDGNLHTVLIRDYLEQVGDTRMLPYLAIIRRKLHDIPITIPHGREHDADLCFGIIQSKLTHPCLLELIWSYWHEEGMLVQTMNAITQRFQNVRAPGVSDALANSEIDMLRPLNNLIWGYTQDEQHRLTVVRRNYEYDHHYGVRLDGKAVQSFRPADSRSKFLEAFHHLLRLCTSFYKQDDDTTVKADAFPVLNALKEVHLILSQGAHNQFGDLPSTARIEMLMQQWLLARPEFREFLPTRVMVAYPEPWMDRVDAMKRIQNWTDTSVVHFRSLAVFGEQLLLSIRYGAWSDIYEPTPAFNWARFWRPQVQGYVHAYRAATGVDLSIEGRGTLADATIPSVLLRQRLAEQVRMAGAGASR